MGLSTNTNGGGGTRRWNTGELRSIDSRGASFAPVQQRPNQQARPSMQEQIDIDELDLSDTELVQVLKNHGMNRRGLMRVLGAGAGITALSGTATASSNRSARIDDVFGAPYSTDESPPPGLADHVVELHAHPDEDPEDGLGALENFPQVPDGPDDDDDPEELPTEFFFDPVGLHVEPGDIVEFQSHNHEHTVTSFHGGFGLPQRVPSGRFSSPPLMGVKEPGLHDSWFYEFTDSGVYDILCLPHIALGMVMRIVVFDPAEDDLSEPTFSDYDDLPPLDFLANANRVLNAPEIDDPDNIVNQSDDEVAWADLTL